MTDRPLNPVASRDPDREAPELDRHQAPGGWRRAVIGAIVGGAFAAVALRWLDRDGPDPAGRDDGP